MRLCCFPSDPQRLAAACRSRECATVGIKKAFPQIKTIGTLNWEEFPPDLPLNVWVDETAVRRLTIAIANDGDSRFALSEC